MRIVTGQELQDWLEHGTVLEKDSRGPKVVLLQNGLILKIFRIRGQAWLARINPPARRFCHNAAVLHGLDIPAPAILDALWLDQRAGLSACLYDPLPGASLEKMLKNSPQGVPALLPDLATFIVKLHHHGIYFRSLHLGNVLCLPDGHFGLIDFLDLKYKRRPLSNWERKRNLEHMRRYLQRRKLLDFPIEQLIQCYSVAWGKLIASSNSKKRIF